MHACHDGGGRSVLRTYLRVLFISKRAASARTLREESEPPLLTFGAERLGALYALLSHCVTRLLYDQTHIISYCVV